MPVVAGLFDNHQHAEAGLDALYRVGFDGEQFEIVYRMDEAQSALHSGEISPLEVRSDSAHPEIRRGWLDGLMDALSAGGVEGLCIELERMGFSTPEAYEIADQVEHGRVAVMVAALPEQAEDACLALREAGAHIATSEMG